MRLGLARAAEVFLGDDPQRVTQTLNRWADEKLPPLQWLPGPLLDALAPLGIEVPKTASGRQVSRLLVGLGGDVGMLDAAVDALRDDALATPARAVENELSAAAERALHDAVDSAVMVLIDAYSKLGRLVEDGAREPVQKVADEAYERMLMASAPVDRLAVELSGARPDRLHSVPIIERPSIDLTKPYRYQPVRRRADVALRAAAFFALAVVAAAGMLWGVVNGRWP